MKPWFSPVIGLALLASTAAGHAEPTAGSPIPIEQSVNRRGALRYAVWIRVGERFVAALLDTGSTGLRVLPTVVPGDLTGLPTNPVFGGTLRMSGLVVKAAVEIGSLRGTIPIEVIDHIACISVNCDLGTSADTYLIGGDGIPAQGYSAILGIGYTSRSDDLPNPLEELGAKRWIVELPRPADREPGHLDIDPDAATQATFAMVTPHGIRDAYGCLYAETGGPVTCGDILFDTGAPSLDAYVPDVETARVWDNGAAGSLHVSRKDGSLHLDFTTRTEIGPLRVTVGPKLGPKQSEPLLNAGLFPFFRYTMLYDAGVHAMGLRSRDAASRPGSHGPDQAKR